jgi:hypothetical protein
MMRRFFGGIIYLGVGVAAGAISAYLSIQNAGVEAASNGSPWRSRTAALTGDSVFYVRSHYLIEGRLPPAQGQLYEATAETDKDGQPLTASCRYRLANIGPLPQWWSIAAIGSGVDDTSRQTTADADTIIREADGTTIISVSGSPQPGNWIKAPRARRFTLLYSAIPLAGQRTIAPPPFTITREGC